MLQSDVQIGRIYKARVSGRLVDVQLDNIYDGQSGFGTYRRNVKRFYVTNLVTGRKLVFRSAAKLRG